MTRRLCTTRKNEVSISMTGGCPLRQVYAINMPFYQAVEQRAHQRLRRLRDRSDRGTEWYRLKQSTDLGLVIGEVRKAALEIRRTAKRRHLWSPEADERMTAWRLAANGPVLERLVSL